MAIGHIRRKQHSRPVLRRQICCLTSETLQIIMIMSPASGGFSEKLILYSYNALTELLEDVKTVTVA